MSRILKTCTATFRLSEDDSSSVNPHKLLDNEKDEESKIVVTQADAPEANLGDQRNESGFNTIAESERE